MVRIVIVDDHKLFLEGLSVLISELNSNFEIETSSDPHAFVLSLDQPRTIDLLICDLLMTPVNGLSVIRAFRKAFPRTPVLVLSGTTLDPPVAELRHLNVKGFLHKSIELNEMKSAVSIVLSGQTCFPDNIADLMEKSIDYDLGADLPPQPAPELSPRQFEVLQMIAEGASNRNISERLDLSENTIKTYIKQLFLALDVNTRTSCVRRAQQIGLI